MNNFTYNKDNGISMESYFRVYGFIAKYFAISFVAMMLSSCANKTGNSMFQTSENATNAYRCYLSEIRTLDDLTSEQFADVVNEWLTLRDSVFNCLARDSVVSIHSGHMGIVQEVNDSLRKEFVRISMSRQRTFSDVVYLHKEVSQHKYDQSLAKSSSMAEPFFESLDSVSPCRMKPQEIIAAYHSFLDKMLERGINNNEELLSFIKEEDRMFRSYLIHLSELANADLSAITQLTEKCCLSVFQATENGTISYDDAMIYMAKRTNRRVILNAEACIGDVQKGLVRTGEQARAYVWMLLQPYITLDTLGAAVLSEAEYAKLGYIAGHTLQVIDKLNGIIGTDSDQYKELPALLIKILLTSI